MSTWAEVIRYGRGAFGFRLEVEGWPQEWVTDSTITHASGAAGRSVYPGLQYDGLRISERAILKEAWFELASMTVKINPTSYTEETLQFTRDVTPVDWMPGPDGIEETDTALTPQTGTNLALGVFHCGTEAFGSDGSGGITRGVWGTTAQVHHTHIEDKEESVPIYAWPPTMEGRRARLYVYGSSDDKAGNGTLLWQGKVSRPPSMDGVAWTISIESIASVFEQTVAGRARQWRPTGIYHSLAAPFYIEMRIGGVQYLDYVYGFYATDTEFAQAVTDKMAAMLASASYTRVSFTYQILGGVPRLAMTTGSTLPADALANGFTMAWGAIQEGYSPESFFGNDWFNGLQNVSNTSAFGGAPHLWANLTVDTDYYYDLPFSYQPFFKNVPQSGAMGGGTPAFPFPLYSVRSVLGVPQSTNKGLRPLTGSYAAAPPSRIYLDADVSSIAVNDEIVLTDGDGPHKLTVTSTDNTDRWIEVEYGTLTKPILLTGAETITSTRHYPSDGDISDFMDAVTDNAKYANDGDVPYIIDTDVADWGDVIDRLNPGVAYMHHREYLFDKPVAVKDVVQEELKALGAFPHLDAAAKVTVSPLPNLESHETPDDTLTDDDILVPAEGTFGELPRWDEQVDGLVNSVKLRLGYKPEDDSFDEAYDQTIYNRASIAEHKTRGSGELEIAPRSRPSLAWRVTATGGGILFGIPGFEKPSPDDCARIAAPTLVALSKDYAIVTVCVSFRKYPVLLGYTLEVTSAFVPDGNGNRGVTARRAVVIGRDWDLDPAAGMGKLMLYMQRGQATGVGYTPSGMVASQTNVSGDTWDIFFSTADPWNLLFSEAHDGEVVQHFAVGDLVTIYKWNTVSPTKVDGQVLAVDTSLRTIRVIFGSTWTPGSDTWVLRWSKDAGSATAHQRSFVFVADSTARLADPDSTVARRFA